MQLAGAYPYELGWGGLGSGDLRWGATGAGRRDIHKMRAMATWSLCFLMVVAKDPLHPGMF